MLQRLIRYYVVLSSLLAGMLLVGCSEPPTVASPPPVEPTTVTIEPTRTVPTRTLAPTPTPMPTPTAVITVVSTTTTLAPITPLSTRDIVDRPLRNVSPLTDGTTPYRIAQWGSDSDWIAAVPQDGPGLDVINAATGEVRHLVTDTYVLEPVWIDGESLLVHRTGATGDELVKLTIGEVTHTEVIVQHDQPVRAVGAWNDGIVLGTDGGLHLVSQITSISTTINTLNPIITALTANAAGETLVAFNPWISNLEDVQTMVLRLGEGRANLTNLSDRGEGLWLPRWSPDATRLALTSIESRIVTTTLDGSERYDLGPGDQPAWSPDGLRLAYVGANAGVEWISRDIYLVDWQGRERRMRLTHAGEGEFFTSPSWSPDGTRIAFVEIDSGQVFVGDVTFRE